MEKLYQLKTKNDHGDTNINININTSIDVNVNADEVLKAYTIFQKYDRNDFQRVMKGENIFQDIIIFNTFLTSCVNAKQSQIHNKLQRNQNIANVRDVCVSF